MRGAAFLEKALSGEPLVWSDIEDLRSRRVREDQWLEYKRGAWVLGNSAKASKPGQPTKGADRLRKWVFAFANAEGGALVIGMAGPEPQSAKDADGDESASQPYDVDGCPELKPTPTEWATRTLRDLFAFLPSPLACHELEAPDGRVVLIVAVSRALSLVPCIEQGERVHYLRHGDETRQMSMGLFTDLTLGRRQRPALSLRIEDVGKASQSIAFRVCAENEGLSAIASSVMALLMPGPRELQRFLTVGLRRLVEVGTFSWGWEPRAIIASRSALSPLDATSYGLAIPYPQHPSIARVAIAAAVVYVPEGGAPRLIQIDARLEDEDTPRFEYRELPPNELGRVSLEVLTM
jgi:hypothetical protein